MSSRTLSGPLAFVASKPFAYTSAARWCSHREIGKWNELVAAAVGAFKDMTEGRIVQAPITEFPNFEHLEAKGLAELRRKFKRGK